MSALRELHTWWYNSDAIIGMLHRNGWRFCETDHVTMKHELQVAFTRRDWHGLELEQEVAVTRSGPATERRQLVRDAGREALALYREFRKRPEIRNDPKDQELDWYCEK